MADQTHPTPEALRATDPRTLAADDDPKACLRDCRVTDDNYPAPCFTHPDVIATGCSRQRATRATVAADGPTAHCYMLITLRRGKTRAVLVGPGGALFTDHATRDAAIAEQFAAGWATADVSYFYPGSGHGNDGLIIASRPELPSGRATGREGGTEGDA